MQMKYTLNTVKRLYLIHAELFPGFSTFTKRQNELIFRLQIKIIAVTHFGHVFNHTQFIHQYCWVFYSTFS